MSDISATERPKRAAGRAALELVEDGMRLGLGTGSTVRWFLEGLAERRLDVAGVPTSHATAERCDRLEIALLEPSDVTRLDLAVDGADEFDPDLTATKGGGGALLREKVVATMSDRFVLIVTADKAVARLGDTFPLPIEVVPFAAAPVTRALREQGAEVTARVEEDGAPYLTDNGNVILDARYPGGIGDPPATELALARIPGVVANGLFVGLADLAMVGHADGGVERRARSFGSASTLR